MRWLKNCPLYSLLSVLLVTGCATSSPSLSTCSTSQDILRSTIDQEQKLLLGGEPLTYLDIPKFNLCVIGRQMRDGTVSLTRGMLSECRRAHDEGNMPGGIYVVYADRLKQTPELFSRFFSDKKSGASFLLIMSPTGSTSLIRLTTEEIKNPAIAAALAQISASN